jgi:hypothetical protein
MKIIDRKKPMTGIVSNLDCAGDVRVNWHNGTCSFITHQELKHSKLGDKSNRYMFIRK